MQTILLIEKALCLFTIVVECCIKPCILHHLNVFRGSNLDVAANKSKLEVNKAV